MLYTAARIFVKRNTVTVDELGVSVLYEIRIVLGVMLARFRYVIAEAADILKSYKVLEILGRVVEYLVGTTADLGVEIVSVGIKALEKECHVVDTGDLFFDGLLRLHSELLEEGFRADLNAVAEPYRTYSGISLHISRQHCHRIRIVEEECVRADLHNILGKVVEYGDRAECTEDTSDAESVGYRLAQTVLFRYFKVRDGAGIVEPYLYRVYNKIRTAERILAIFDSHIFSDPASVIV